MASIQSQNPVSEKALSQGSKQVQVESGTQNPDNPTIFLNARRANSGIVSGHEPPKGYQLACKFFTCGIIDRTCTLDQGFPYTVLDPIPEQKKDERTFGEICDEVGSEIVDAATKSEKRIRVLWSGGIDSTTALISLMKATNIANRSDMIVIYLSDHSIKEYPLFYEKFIAKKYPCIVIERPVAKILKGQHLNVTGEHGDQIFGTYMLAPYVKSGRALDPYQDALPHIVFEKLQDAGKADNVIDYLMPQIKSAPVPIKTLFDCLWWINFSMKWQHVTLRIPAFSDDAKGIYNSLNHFFRDERFQNWVLNHPETREVDDWKRYKEAAKRYILNYTGDEDYYQDKIKERSLKNVLRKAEARTDRELFRIHMREDFHPIFEVVNRKG